MQMLDYLFTTSVLWHLKCAKFIFGRDPTPNPCKANDALQTLSIGLNLPIPRPAWCLWHSVRLKSPQNTAALTTNSGIRASRAVTCLCDEKDVSMRYVTAPHTGEVFKKDALIQSYAPDLIKIKMAILRGSLGAEAPQRGPWVESW